MDHASLSSSSLSMSPTLQRTFHWVGSALAIIGIAFVAFRIHVVAFIGSLWRPGNAAMVT